MTLLKCEQTRPKRDQSNPNFKYSDQKPSRSELSFGLSDPSNPNLAHDHQILILLWKKTALHRHELVIVFSRFSLNETTKTTKQRVSPGYIYNESHNHEILYVFPVPRECHENATFPLVLENTGNSSGQSENWLSADGNSAGQSRVESLGGCAAENRTRRSFE